MKRKNIARIITAIYLGNTLLSAMSPAVVMAGEAEEVISESFGEEEASEEVSGGESEEAADNGTDDRAEEALEESSEEMLSAEDKVSGEESETAPDSGEDDGFEEVLEESSEETLSAEDEAVTEESGEGTDPEEDVSGDGDESTGTVTVTFDGKDVTTDTEDVIKISSDDETQLTCVTISKGGEYILTGSGDNVYLNITATDEVTLIQESLSIENDPDSEVAFIEAAKKSKVTMDLEGENTITGGDGAVSQKKNSSLHLTGSGSLTIKEAADDGIKSKGDITVDTCTIVIDRCGGDGIQGENITVDSGSIDITTYYENAATGYYTKGTASVEGYNTIWESGSTKTERVNVDTGSHKGIKAGTKAKTITFSEGDDDGSLSSEESSVASGSLVINGGTINIDTTASGLKANSLQTSGYTAASTGVYIIGSPDDGMSSNNELTINGGDITIAAADDGITAMGDLTIKGSAEVDITTAYEGMEGANITIGEEGAEGPRISINSNDDGINTSSKTLTYVYDSYSGYETDEDTGYYKKSVSTSSGTTCNIYSGTVNIAIDSENTHSVQLPDGEGTKSISFRASGDGIDCNGSLYVEGGNVYVFGQTSGDNSPIDTNTGFSLGSSATVLGTGTDGMNESKPEAGDGVYITYGSGAMGGPGQGGSSASISAGAKLTVSDGTNEIINTTLPYAASFLVFASPLLTEGNTYTLKIGDLTATVTAMAAGSQTTGGQGGSGQGGEQPGGQGGPGQGDGQQPPTPPTGEFTPSGNGMEGQLPPAGEGGQQPPTPPTGEFTPSGNGMEGQLPPTGEGGQQPPTPPAGEDGQQAPPSGDAGVTSQSSVSAAADITVLPVKDKSLNVADKLTPKDGGKIRYVVSGNAVKVSKKGQVKAKRAGEAVIKSQVKKDGKWQDTGLSYRVKVEAPVVTKKKELKTGESITVKELIDAASTSLSPSGAASSNTAVASVDESGVIKALSAGRTVISFKLGGVTCKTRITVK